MTLDEYLTFNSVTYAAFGQRIGVRPQSVHRYAKYGRIPAGDILGRISRATNGKVTPNDFFPVERKVSNRAYRAAR